MNPMQMLQALKNPRQFVENYAKNNGNPMLNNLINMAQNNDTQGIENFARNMFKEQGRNYDSEMEQFKKLMGNSGK